jgi:hypothetical protein
VVSGALDGGVVVDGGGGVGFVEVGGGPVVDGGAVVGGGPVVEVGGAVGAGPEAPVVGGTAGSTGAVEGGVVGTQSAGIDAGGSATVPDGVVRPVVKTRGRIDENARIRDAGVRSQFTPGGTWPPE